MGGAAAAAAAGAKPPTAPAEAHSTLNFILNTFPDNFVGAFAAALAAAELAISLSRALRPLRHSRRTAAQAPHPVRPRQKGCGLQQHLVRFQAKAFWRFVGNGVSAKAVDAHRPMKDRRTRRLDPRSDRLMEADRIWCRQSLALEV